MAIISKAHLNPAFLSKVVQLYNPVRCSDESGNSRVDTPNIYLNISVLLDAFAHDQLGYGDEHVLIKLRGCTQSKDRIRQVDPRQAVSLESGLTFFTYRMQCAVETANISPSAVSFQHLRRIACGPYFHRIPANLFPPKFQTGKGVLNPSESMFTILGLPAWHRNTVIPNKEEIWRDREVVPYILGHFAEYCIRMTGEYYIRVLRLRQSSITEEIKAHEMKKIQSFFRVMGRQDLIWAHPKQRPKIMPDFPCNSPGP